MQTILFGLNEDLESIFFNNIITRANLNESESLHGIFQIEMPLSLTSKIFDEFFLLLTNLRIITIPSNSENSTEVHINRFELSAIKCVIFSTKVNDLLLSFNSPTVPKEILIRSDENEDILECISKIYQAENNCRLNIYKCDFKHLTEKRNIDYLNLLHGNIISYQNTNRSGTNYLSKYKQISILGHGVGRKVLLVRHTESKKLLALKMLNKLHLIEQGGNYLRIEKFILDNLNSKFLIQMEMDESFQTERSIILIMPFMQLDLYNVLKYLQKLPEDTVKFYSLCIAFGIQALHDYQIVYRDLKPENILIDDQGYPLICDFGLSCLLYPTNKAYTLCGTPQYFAPELIVKNSHDNRVDWWTLGVLIYELLCGFPPFSDPNSNSLYEKIIYSEVAFPEGISAEAKEIISKLLEKNPDKRLGGKHGLKEFLQLDFFKGIDYKAIKKKKATAPLISALRQLYTNYDQFPETEISEDELFPLENHELETLRLHKEDFAFI